MYNDVDRKEKNHMENNYWITLAQDETSAPEDTFLRIRELYNNLLKHLYDNPRDIPDFRIHFSTVQMSEEEGLNNGYHVATLTRRSREIAESVIHNVTEIPNFENSYTWYQDNIFVIFDYCGSGINPLQFVTRAFWEEVYKQLYFYGIRRVSIGHMYDLIISGGEFKAPTLSLTGDMAAATFKNIHVDKLFLATAGISADFQLTYPSLSDLAVKSAMLRAASQVYLLADSSKLGYSSFASLGRISLIDTLITDNKITAAQLDTLKEMKVSVL